MIVLFGMYSFNNPDEKTNGDVHCFANSEDKVAVEEESGEAIDVTFNFLLFFRINFVLMTLYLIEVIFLILTIVLRSTRIYFCQRYIHPVVSVLETVLLI